jgi:hypothetical protein
LAEQGKAALQMNLGDTETTHEVEVASFVKYIAHDLPSRNAGFKMSSKHAAEARTGEGGFADLKGSSWAVVHRRMAGRAEDDDDEDVEPAVHVASPAPRSPRGPAAELEDSQVGRPAAAQ